jgi:hypothetical protein
LVGGWNSPTRRGVNDSYLEAEPLQAEVALDLMDETVDGRVGSDRPTATRLSVGPGQSRLVAFPVGSLEQPFETSPV